jgi:hypothetical protein
MGNFLTGTREANARPGVVWDILTDVDAWPRTFTPHLSEARLDGDVEVGAEGWVQARLPIPRSGFEVTAVEEGRSWAWRGKVLWLTMDFDHIVEPIDGSNTRITFDIGLDGPLAALFRPLFRLQYKPNLEVALDRLVEVSEQRAG